MSDRYFVRRCVDGDRAVLAGAEAHHLIHVMRATPGAQVVLFDGSGAEFTARIERIGRAEVELAILSRRVIDRELAIDVTLGVTLPKGERQKWLVEKAVELGVKRIVPLVTARSVAKPGRQAAARLRRTVVEASKQCGRNRLLEIAEPLLWTEFVAATGGFGCRLLAHPNPPEPDADAAPATDPLVEVAESAELVLAAGPEGGFTSEEVATAIDAGWRVIDLGPRMLRTETAAIVLTAMVASRLLRW